MLLHLFITLLNNKQAFTVHFASKAMPIHFIDGNNNYNYIGLICNSSIWN